MHCQSPFSSPKPANCCFHHLAVVTERLTLSGAGTLLVRQGQILGLWQVFLSWNSVTLEYRLSTFHAAQYKDAAMASGANGYAAKEYLLAELLPMIRGVVGNPGNGVSLGE